MKYKYVIIIGFIFIIIFFFHKTPANIRFIDSALNSLNIFPKSEREKSVIFVEVDKKQLSLINRVDGSVLKTYTIATGKPNSPTPLGSFQITEKAHWGEGFGSRWIGLNVPWGKYGIHGTNKPGSIGGNVSAGCIRMRNIDVEDLYDRISKTTPVVIQNGEFGPFGPGFRTLKPGDRGADVLEVQKRLFQYGYYKSDLDGIYGEDMKRALIDFLKDKALSLTDRIDGDIYRELGIVLMD